MNYSNRIPRASALIGRTANGWELVSPIWRRETLYLSASDRRANGEAFPGECVIRLPRRFCRPQAWPGARGPGSRYTMPAAQVLAHVERALRFHEPLPSYVPRTIGLPQAAGVCA